VEYTKRHAVWHDKPATDTPILAADLQAFDDALDKLLGKDTPAVDEVGVWTPGSGGLIYQKVGTNQLADGAVTNVKVAAAAAIAYSKLNLAGSVKLNADVDTTTALAIARLAGYPGDGTKRLAGDGSWPSTPTITYGTSPPGSPTTGDIHYLVDSATAPTYQWAFRYNGSSTNPDKWEFVGGPPAFAEVTASEAANSTTYVALSTPGPAITLPRAGQYQVEIGFMFVNPSVGGGFALYMSYDIGGTGAVDADAIGGSNGVQVNIATAAVVSVNRVRQKTIASGPTTLTAKYRNNAATASYLFGNRWMRVTPIRVS